MDIDILWYLMTAISYTDSSNNKEWTWINLVGGSPQEAYVGYFTRTARRLSPVRIRVTSPLPMDQPRVSHQVVI